MPSITSTDAATVSLRGIAFDNSTEAYNNSANALAHMASDVSVLGSAQPGHQLPHVDDITAFPRDIDVNQSIKRLLDTAELSLRSAETSRDFRRPGIALKEYIKASYICVVTIKGHKDYPTLQSGWGDLTKKHNALLRKIDALHGTYEQIKKDIKEDNLRTGARPAASKAAAHSQANAMAHTLSEPPLPGHQALNLALSQQNRQSQPPLGFQAFQGKSKPPIQPKPESLHGNALKGGHGRSSSASVAQDSLALRLAALRGPQPSPGQDPRIRTHPIVPPKPAGPREMPSTRPKIGIDSSVSSFPKMPDAIYSPVRGTVTDEAAKLPSSTPRGLFSRTGSSTSITSNPNAPTQQSYMDYSPPPPSDSPSLDRRLMQPSSGTSSPRPSLDVPSGETITAQKLFELMKAKGSILIMDIRPREDFDEGHIMSTSTICLEPDILTRESLSCDQISESLILSPIQEKSAFDKRSEYDLVVMYDDATEAMPRMPRNAEELALMSLRRALVDLNYGRELKQPPRLLQGGIEAWVNLLGSSSLQSTSESSTKTAQLRLGNNGQIGRKKSKYLAKPLKPDDVKAWQNTVNQDDADIASSPMLYRTTEDFIRRYPAVSLEQESMTSPAAEPLVMSNKPAGASNWGSDAPIPPAKPGKAVARPTHNGLSHEGGENGSSQQASGQMTANSRPKGTPDGPNGPARRFRYTTLNNPGSWCYSNSLLQAIFASGLGKVLSSHDWKNEFPVPKKEGERIPQPQLMMQILANLFHWMSTGGFEVMKAQTFMVSLAPTP
jgi:ubiquitin carboxyl-terminal hydrolase 8